MRAVHFDDAPITDDFVHFMETCVQCRGCEPACPSGVPFGQLMEGTRDTLTEQTPHDAVVAAPRLPRARPPSCCCWSARRCLRSPNGCGWYRSGWGCRSWRCGAGRHHNRQAATRGCSPDASWMRGNARPIATPPRSCPRVGVTYLVPGSGRRVLRRACTSTPASPMRPRSLAERVMRSMPGNAPIVVNSAGCGAALKDYGHLLGTDEAKAFSARVRDASEFVAPLVDRLAGATPAGPGHGAGSVPSSPRAARPSAGAHRAGRGCRHRRARRRGTVLWRGRRVLDVAARARRRRSATASWRRSNGPVRRSSPAPTRGVRSTSPLPVSTSSTRWISSPRRCERRSMMDGRYDDLVDRLQVLSTTSTRSRSISCAKPPQRAGPGRSTTSG